MSADSGPTTTHFLTLPLSVSYALCLSPFYLQLTPVTTKSGATLECYVVKSWLPQKILCGALTILDFFWIIRFLRKSPPTDYNNPSHHIGMIIVVISEMYKCAMFKALWMNSADFAKLANFILYSELPKLDRKWVRSKLLVWALIIIYICLGLGYMDWVGGNIEAGADFLAELNLKEWWNGMVEAGRFNYFLFGNSNTERPDRMYASVTDIFIGISAVFGLLHRYR